jgi:hypothetical protein
LGLAPAVEAEVRAAAAPPAGAAALVALEVCGRPANRARQRAAARVEAEPAQVVLVAVGETEAAQVEVPGAAEGPVVVAVAADSEAAAAVDQVEGPAAVADQSEVRGADLAAEVELAAGAEAAVV